jgi:archaemetzincin
MERGRPPSANVEADEFDCSPQRPAWLAPVGLVMALVAAGGTAWTLARPVPAGGSIAAAAPPALTTAEHDGAPADPWAWPSEAWWTDVERSLRRLEPLHLPMPRPSPGDWLMEHPEGGQSFRQFLERHPSRPSASAHTIYVQPLGEFTPSQRRVVAKTTEYLEQYFGLPIRTLPDLPLSVVPADAFRQAKGGERQMHSGTLLREVLRPRMPVDAAALIAFTAVDLFPDPRWNFVFGEASLDDAVGVWSLARLGHPEAGDAGFRRCLLRTMKIAAHETGHMFGLFHCTAHLCNMNGSNSLVESDQAPLAPCPQCLAKVSWLTGRPPRATLAAIAAFASANGYAGEAAPMQADLKALQSKR